MRNRWDIAGADAMKRWDSALEQFGGEDEPRPAPREAVMERYVRDHRNKWKATLAFAQQRVGQQEAPGEARRYIEEMERRLTGGRGGM